MSKKVKTFFKIIYYVFTFGLGIVLAFVLPGMKFYEGLAETMEKSLTTGNYDKAMSLIGGYYDEEEVALIEYEDGSGIVMYSAAVEAYNQETKKYYMNPTYAGFLFNTKGTYNVKANDANRTRLVVEDANGVSTDITILNYDSDQDKDKKVDSITTLENYTYVYFEIPVGKVDSISKLTFKDVENKDYRVAEGLDLDFSEAFFTDVQDFVKAYNNDPLSDSLEKIGSEFEAKNTSYKKNDPSDVYKKANTDATIFVLVYFIWVYILGDFLVGRRYIWRGCKWCYIKCRDGITKAKRKKLIERGEEVPKELEEIAPTLNTLLKFELKVPASCNTNVSINYHNENSEINLVLTRDNGYKQNIVVPAGTYVNAWLECPGYHTVNLPKTLDVKGYRMIVEVTLEKSDKNLMDENENINNTTEVKDENQN